MPTNIPSKSEILKTKTTAEKKRISKLKESAETKFAKAILRGFRAIPVSKNPVVQSHIIKLLKEAGWNVEKTDEPKTLKGKRGKLYNRTIPYLRLS